MSVDMILLKTVCAIFASYPGAIVRYAGCCFFAGVCFGGGAKVFVLGGAYPAGGTLAKGCSGGASSSTASGVGSIVAFFGFGATGMTTSVSTLVFFVGAATGVGASSGS